MKSYLVSGGSASGKSRFAQRLAVSLGEPVLYLATGQATSPEMGARIRRHQAARPAHWQTVEAPRGLAAALAAADDGAPVVLLEDLPSLLHACLPGVDVAGGQLVAPEAAEHAAERTYSGEIDGVVEWCANRDRALVLVTLEVGLGALPPSPRERLFKDVLGHGNQRLARRVDAVYFVASGLPIDLTALARETQLCLPEG